MRHGRLAQSAAALYLFLRDVCGGDFIGWIDDQLSRSNEPDAAPIIDALRHIHGVSDKVLSLALACSCSADGLTMPFGRQRAPS
jgi:hypothetical protein